MLGNVDIVSANSVNGAVEWRTPGPKYAHHLAISRPRADDREHPQPIQGRNRSPGLTVKSDDRHDAGDRDDPVARGFGNHDAVPTDGDDPPRHELATEDLNARRVAVAESVEQLSTSTARSLKFDYFCIVGGVGCRIDFRDDAREQSVHAGRIDQTRRVAERFIHSRSVGVDSAFGSDMECVHAPTNDSKQRQTTSTEAHPNRPNTVGPCTGGTMSTATTAEQPLPLEWTVPSGLPATPKRARHLTLVTPSPDPVGPETLEAAGRLPAPAPWVARLAPALLEVAAGERPPGQLTRWVTADIRETLARRGAAARRHPAGKDLAPQCRRVRSVRVTSPAPGVIEASAVVIGAVRARAVALRLEAIRGRWLATAVEFG